MNKASSFSIAGQGHVTMLDLTPFGQWLLGKSIIHNGLFLGGGQEQDINASFLQRTSQLLDCGTLQIVVKRGPVTECPECGHARLGSHWNFESGLYGTVCGSGEVHLNFRLRIT